MILCFVVKNGTFVSLDAERASQGVDGSAAFC